MSGSDYSFASKVLHALALGNRALAEASFDVEQSLHARAAGPVGEERHVFVAGLARAGTTILMRSLHETGLFCSLTYRDMPFVLSPNLWRAISRRFRREALPRERAHGDGILVDFDSPEALEEVFWRVFCGDDYIRPDRLIPMLADDETVARFRAYVRVILKGGGIRRYLSKNNNNILRLGSIATAFPAAAFLIPFREPVQHAGSLMRQHRHFLAVHEADPFSRRYMTWLAHHEMGADHRPFVFGERPDPQAVDDLSYWLRLWISTYGHLRETAPAQAIFVSYERLCEHTAAVWGELSERLGIPPERRPESLRLSRRAVTPDVSPRLLVEASDLYQALTAAAL